ncbi:hypothetical protein HDU99_001713 [Rhizoclosmatium hyalinum]|nr:hypothetical protein HDU99_001713 [Rhizoclosmatium hyalinum]
MSDSNLSTPVSFSTTAFFQDSSCTTLASVSLTPSSCVPTSDKTVPCVATTTSGLYIQSYCFADSAASAAVLFPGSTTYIQLVSWNATFCPSVPPKLIVPSAAGLVQAAQLPFNACVKYGTTASTYAMYSRSAIDASIFVATFADSVCRFPNSTISLAAGYGGCSASPTGNKSQQVQAMVMNPNGAQIKVRFDNADCQNAIGLNYGLATTPCQPSGNLCSFDTKSGSYSESSCYTGYTNSSLSTFLTSSTFKSRRYATITRYFDAACLTPRETCVAQVDTCVSQKVNPQVLSYKLVVADNGTVIKYKFSDTDCVVSASSVSYAVAGNGCQGFSMTRVHEAEALDSGTPFKVSGGAFAMYTIVSVGFVAFVVGMFVLRARWMQKKAAVAKEETGGNGIRAISSSASTYSRESVTESLDFGFPNVYSQQLKDRQEQFVVA